MRILFISSRLPYPPIHGDRVRAFHQLRILSLRHRLTLVSPIEHDSEREGLKFISQYCERIHVFPVHRWRRALNLAKLPFSHLPLQCLYFFDARLSRIVQCLCDKKTFDLVHVQLIRMAPLADGLEGVPKVIDLIDALSLNMYRRALRERGPLRPILAVEAGRVSRYERALATRFDHLLVSSPLDKQVVGPYANIHVVPNGVDIGSFPFVEDGRELNTLIFTGRIRYFPNADAAMYFATEVFPLIRREVRDARFLIVGADPSQKITRLHRLPGVTVTGYVPSLHEYLARATVAVAPMRAGSGMQFKVLEAMASGVPVVATPYALGGLSARDGEHLLIGLGTEDIAEKVVCLLREPDLRRRLSRNARKLVEANHTWERSVALLEAAYEKACRS